MRNLLRSFLMLCTVAGFYSCRAQADPTIIQSGSSIPADLDSFVRKQIARTYGKGPMPGIFVGVLHNGQRKYYTAGYANRERKIVFDSLTVFEAGSITKTFTAYVLLSVLNEKKISDTSLVIHYLPDSVGTNTKLGAIRFLHLVNHSSGLPRLPENMDPGGMQPYEQYGRNDLFSYLRTCEPAATGNYNYSNLGFGLAAVLAEKISGRPFNELLTQEILLPFGISDSSSAKSIGYFDGNPTPYWNMDAMQGAGALRITGSGMLDYLQVMSNPVNATVQSIVDSLTSPTLGLSESASVARAWHTIESDQAPIIFWHNGGTYGFSTFSAFSKKENKAVIVVINAFNKNSLSDGLGVSIMKEMLKTNSDGK